MPEVTILAQAALGLDAGVIGTAFVFGVRHGFDWDHIAAISDITGSTREPRRSIAFSSLYALGHALVVLVLGLLAVVGGNHVPAGFDAAMERVVGASLLLLGAYVFYSLLRNRRDFRMQSRWMLMLRSVHRVVHRIRTKRDAQMVVVEHEHEHEPGAHGHGDDHMTAAGSAGSGARTAVRHRHTHRHVAAMPPDPFARYGPGTSFGVGMIHGVGAETPTQVVLFVTAAGVSGNAGGVAMLLAFVAGLLISNTLVAFASTFGFLRAERSFVLYAGVAALAGGLSLVLGAALLFGAGGSLPDLFG